METQHTRNQHVQLNDEFLSHVSHELRSPLAAIYEFVSIVSDGIAGEINAEQAEYLQIATKNVLQLRSMIDDLLDVTRAQAGKLRIEPRCISVPDVAVEAVNLYRSTAAAREVALTFEAAAGLPRAYADPRRIRQIIVNLISNAIKFTPAKGRVKLHAGIYEKNPNFLSVEVTDTGFGLSEESSRHVFERLYQVPDSQVARKGLGLGLYICKELVSRHGGEIWVRTRLGEGSAFCFTVPIFSLAALIAPMFRDATKCTEPVAILVVRMRPESGWATEEAREEASLDARNFLQRCLPPGLDVLLPEMGPTGSDDVLFLLVARANEAGAIVMSRRICEQFSINKPLARSGLTFAICHRVLATAPHVDREPTEEFVNRMAARMRECIDGITRPGSDRDEP